MRKLIYDFTSHLKKAISIWETNNFDSCVKKIDNVVICGVGGSGIGGTIVAQLTAMDSSVPIIVNKGYELPGFVNERTLVIISSYSGNTEETMGMLKQAQRKDAEIACITSGGSLEITAKINKYNYVVVPGGNPPRAALGLTLPMIFFILNRYALVPSYKEDFENAIKLLNDNREFIISEGTAIADTIFGKTPVIYSDTWTEGVCVRLRQQLNENSKILCWHHAFPEMNHNELVGWSEDHSDKAVVIFRNESDHPKVQKRMEIVGDILEEHTSNIIETYSKGDTPLQRALYLIQVGDWASYFLAKKRNVDVTEVKVIDYLKGQMKK